MSSSARATESTMEVRVMNQIDRGGFTCEWVVEALFPIYAGSMTRLPEHGVHGRVQVQNLFQTMHPLKRLLAALRFGNVQLAIERRVLLQREETGKNLLFAASWTAFAILPPSTLRRSQQQDTPRPLERRV